MTLPDMPIPSSQEFLAIPWHRIQVLQEAKVSRTGVFVYLILWRLSRMRKQWTVPLSSAALAPFGLGRWDKARALASLERMGLIQVVRQRGKNPWVTLVVERPPWRS